MGKPTYISLHKNCGIKSGSIKDVDKRTVTGYFASFDTLDSDGDVFQKGAFSKTIRENKDRILHLLQHDPNKPLGRPDVLKEDNNGLYFETTFADTPLSNDVITLYKDGVYNEHSVGFEMLKSIADSTGRYPQVESRWNAGQMRPANIITETKLYEGSTVAWGANQHTPFTGLKSLQEMKDRTGVLNKALHSGEYSDETYTLLEKELKKLELLLSLEPVSTQAEVEKKNALTFQHLKQINL